MKKASLTALLLLLFGCAQTPPPPPAPAEPVADLKAQIDANNAAWAAAANRGDAAAVASMYTENATMLPPGTGIQQGRAAIQKTVAAIGRSGVRNFALQSVSLDRIGPDTAREIGQFTLDAPGPIKKHWVKVHGKYVVIWKLANGKWMLDTDIWNTNK
jgi:uncharacterized protein (TIGR02246 family)